MRAKYFQVGKKWFLTIDTDDMDHAAAMSPVDASADALSGGSGAAAQGAEDADVPAASLGDLVFMLDLSGSMEDATSFIGSKKIDCLTYAFNTLMQHPNVQRASSIRVIGFSERVQLDEIYDGQGDFQAFVNCVIPQLRTYSTTSIESALTALIPAEKGAATFDLNKTQVVIMSDGEDCGYKGQEGGLKILQRLQAVTPIEPIEPIVIGIPGANDALSSDLNAWMGAISPNASMIIDGAQLEACMPGLSALCVRMPVVLQCKDVAERMIQVRGGGYQELLDSPPALLQTRPEAVEVECVCVEMAAVPLEIKQQALLAWANDIIARAEAERRDAAADEQGLGAAVTAEWTEMLTLAGSHGVILAPFNIHDDLTTTLRDRRARHDVSSEPTNSRFVSRTRTRYTQGAASTFGSNGTDQGAVSRCHTLQRWPTGGGTGGDTGAGVQPKAANRLQAPKATKPPANPSAGAGPSRPTCHGVCLLM